MRSSRALPDFTKWLTSVDQPVRHRVLARIVRAEAGNLGDHKIFGAVGEMRIDFGPGYRIYFTLRGQEIDHPAVRREQENSSSRHCSGKSAGSGFERMKAMEGMMTKTIAFDPAGYLDDAGQTHLLNDAIASGEAAYIAHAIGTIARAKGGLLNLERRTGIKRQSLAKSFGPTGNPTLDTLTHVLPALGLRLMIQPIELLPEAA